MLRPQFGGDLECAKRLDLILRRAVPDRISAPEHVVLAAILEELAERMRRAVGVAHEEAPRAAELGIDIAVRFDTVLNQRADESVNAVARAAPGVGALGNSGNETSMIDEETHIRKALRHDSNVTALAVLVRLLAEG